MFTVSRRVLTELKEDSVLITERLLSPGESLTHFHSVFSCSLLYCLHRHNLLLSPVLNQEREHVSPIRFLCKEYGQNILMDTL